MRWLSALALLLSMNAFAKTGEELQAFAAILRDSHRLEDVHSAAMELATDRDGKLLLFQAMNTAIENIEGARHRERLAEDLLIVMTAELGSTEKSTQFTASDMLNHRDARVRTAAAIFMREHFQAKDPASGYFPSRPNEKERLGGYLAIWAESQNQQLGPALSRLKYNAQHDPDSEARASSHESLLSIRAQLQTAAADRFPEKEKLNKQDERMIQALRLRQKIARNYLDATGTAPRGQCETGVLKEQP